MWVTPWPAPRHTSELGTCSHFSVPPSSFICTHSARGRGTGCASDCALQLFIRAPSLLPPLHGSPQHSLSLSHSAALRDALGGKGPQRRSQERRGRRLEKAVGGYCQLQIPLKLALAVKEAPAGHILGALEGGYLPPTDHMPTETQRGRWRTTRMRRNVGSKNRETPTSTTPSTPNHWAPRTRRRHQQEHRPQRPTESSDPTQHAKGRAGDCPGPRKEPATRRNVTQGTQPPPSNASRAAPIYDLHRTGCPLTHCACVQMWEDSLVRVPPSRYPQMAEYKRLVREFEDKHGVAPTDDHMAQVYPEAPRGTAFEPRHQSSARASSSSGPRVCGRLRGRFVGTVMSNSKARG